MCAGGVIGGVSCLALVAAGLLIHTGRWKPFRSNKKFVDHSSRQEETILDRYNIDSGQVSPPSPHTHTQPSHPARFSSDPNLFGLYKVSKNCPRTSLRREVLGEI
jgi:hypothetical protein